MTQYITSETARNMKQGDSAVLHILNGIAYNISLFELLLYLWPLC